jgi:hypothetical protein
MFEANETSSNWTVFRVPQTAIAPKNDIPGAHETTRLQSSCHKVDGHNQHEIALF